MGRYSIKELEALSGIKAHTLRIWEQRYNLVTPKRTETNIRFYTDEQLKHILNIAFLNQKGHKISKIAKLSAEEVAEKVNQLSIEAGEFEIQVQAMRMAMINLDERRFEKLLSNSILHQGFESTMIKVVYPFLKRVGDLWCTNVINPAHEHFISNLIRKKLIVAADGQTESPGADSKLFVLFLPEGEQHELGLLFYDYILKSRGHRTIYLGATVPLEDIEQISADFEPDYIMALMSIRPNNRTPEQFVELLSSKLPNQKILLGGQQTQDMTASQFSNITFLHTNEDIIAFIDEISVRRLGGSSEATAQVVN